MARGIEFFSLWVEAQIGTLCWTIPKEDTWLGLWKQLVRSIWTKPWEIKAIEDT